MTGEKAFYEAGKSWRKNYGFGLNPQWSSTMLAQGICAMDILVAGSYGLGLAVGLFVFL